MGAVWNASPLEAPPTDDVGFGFGFACWIVCEDEGAADADAGAGRGVGSAGRLAEIKRVSVAIAASIVAVSGLAGADGVGAMYAGGAAKASPLEAPPTPLGLVGDNVDGDNVAADWAACETGEGPCDIEDFGDWVGVVADPDGPADAPPPCLLPPQPHPAGAAADAAFPCIGKPIHTPTRLIREPLPTAGYARKRSVRRGTRRQ